MRATRDAELRGMSSEDRAGVVYEVLRAILARARDTPDRSGRKQQQDVEGRSMPAWTELSGDLRSRWRECLTKHLGVPEDYEGDTEDAWPAASRHLTAALNDFFGPAATL